MICTACNKESNNRRVCPYCFTPYPADGQEGRPSAPAGRATASRQAVQAQAVLGPLEPARAWFARQTAVVRWSAVGIAVIGVLWLVTPGGDDLPPAGGPVAVPTNVAAEPMTREAALAIIRRTRETALVEEQEGEVFVSYPAASFPVEEDGQLQLVTQFAAADEAVEGRKRRIFFHNPSGRRFAQSDGVTGVTIIR